ncbi:hypothetical protein IY145_13665 [Methylosinus sp. H3A]|nr:hypothetical protein [Methylosinus sp. H3A]
MKIIFAHTSFKWSNLASDNAGVTVVIVGLSKDERGAIIFSGSEARRVDVIGPYLVPGSTAVVTQRNSPISELGIMYLGNMAKDGGNLIMSLDRARLLVERHAVPQHFIRKFFGSEEIIHSRPRACLWLEEAEVEEAKNNPMVGQILDKVRTFRSSSKAPSTRAHASQPHKFVQLSASGGERAIIVPRVSSENRPYLPVDFFERGPVIGDKCLAIYDEPLWNMAILASRLHLIWIATVCSRLEMRFSYGNKIGWNTFPVPMLTEKNKADLTRCAEDTLLARENHFPATIADLYDPETMPEDLRRAHEKNDETLERIYIGRRFKNDTERLEKLFDLYTKMTAAQGAGSPKAKAAKKSKANS